MAVKRFVPHKAPNSILHEDVHPILSYSLVAVGAFFAGALLLGALSVHAETNPSTSIENRANETSLELRKITKRIERIETYIGMKADDVPTTASCGPLEDALPVNDENIQRVSDSTACFKATLLGSDRIFPSVSSIYYRTNANVETGDVTIEIYDFGNNNQAAENFLIEAGYLPIDLANIERERVTVNGHDGIFTYENPSDGSGYERGANRLLINGRYGIFVHGPAVGPTDRELLNDVTEAVRMDAIASL
jgi:hypothetical protein